jgi:hypothetical protein
MLHIPQGCSLPGQGRLRKELRISQGNRRFRTEPGGLRREPALRKETWRRRAGGPQWKCRSEMSWFGKDAARGQGRPIFRRSRRFFRTKP